MFWVFNILIDKFLKIIRFIRTFSCYLILTQSPQAPHAGIVMALFGDYLK